MPARVVQLCDPHDRDAALLSTTSSLFRVAHGNPNPTWPLTGLVECVRCLVSGTLPPPGYTLGAKRASLNLDCHFEIGIMTVAPYPAAFSYPQRIPTRCKEGTCGAWPVLGVTVFGQAKIFRCTLRVCAGVGAVGPAIIPFGSIGVLTIHIFNMAKP